MKVTYTDALNTAIAILNSTEAYGEEVEALTATTEKLVALRDTIEKRNAKRGSDEAKAKVNAQRKAKNAQERKAVVDVVVPVLREGLTHTQIGLTAKELYEVTKDELPSDFSVAKVQYVLLHEMVDEVVKTEAKGKANTYRLA